MITEDEGTENGAQASDAAAETPAPNPTPTPSKPDSAALVDGLDKVLDATREAEGAEGVDEPPAGATGATATAQPAGATAAAEPTPEEKAAAELRAKEDAELAALGVRKNGAAAKRYRELHSEARKVPELTKQVETLKPLAEQAERINAIFAETRATKDQIGETLWYLKATNSGDPEQLNKAFDRMVSEVQRLGKILGRPIDGFDPVAEHPDLTAEIEASALTPERARETVRTRAQQRLDEERRQQQTDQQRADEERKQLVQGGLDAVNALGAKLQADPHYKAKIEKLMADGVFDEIKENYHPARWAEAVQRAYTRLPDPAPAPTPAPIGHMPMRPTGAGVGAQMQAKPKDALDAFDIGLRQAGGQLG